MSDRFVGQKTNFVGQIKFVGQMDFRIFRILHLSDRFVGQITNLSGQIIFCRTDLICSKYCVGVLSDRFVICRTENKICYLSNKFCSSFCVCRTESVGQICSGFVGDRFVQDLSDR